MSDKGWIVMDRAVQDHWLWEDRPFSKGQAWIDLLLLANHKDEKFPYKDGVIDGKRGCVYRSLSFLADRWDWSRDKVRRFLNQLESDSMVVANTSTHNTTITIVNYGKYQDFRTTNNTTNSTTNNTTKSQQTDSKPTASRQQAATYNNDNNVNNIGIGNNFTSLAEAVGAEAPLPNDRDLYQIVNAWNQIPHTVKITSIVPMTKRYDQLRAAMNIVGADGVMQAIQSVKESDWLAERGHVVFDQWIVPDRVQGLIEGTYQEKYDTQQKGGYTGELGIDWEAVEKYQRELSKVSE